MDSSGADDPSTQEVLLEFRAGKMFLEGKRVIPDTRKGLVRLIKGEEGLVHFQWIDRAQNVMEDDQIVFPDEAIFEKVEQSSGRVYILKFSTDDRKSFFWMQEPKSDGDIRICTLVNYHINRPLDDVAEASVPFQTSVVPQDVGNEVTSRDGNLDTTNMAAETAGEVSSSGPVQFSDLQRILSSIQPADAAIGLGDILKPDLLRPLINSLSLEQQLAAYLPEGQWTPDELIELLQSPPFRQQVDSFTYVLRTGQIDLQQFGVDPSKYKFTVLSFLEALEDSVAKNLDPENVMQDSVAASESNVDANMDCQSRRHGGEDKMDES